MTDAKRWLTRTLLFSLFVLAVADTMRADPSEDCKAFEAVAHLHVITYHDHGEEGTSHGDRRILRWGLNDEDDSTRVGTAYVHSTVMHPETQGEYPTMVEIIFDLDKGTIFAILLAKLSDPSATDKSADHRQEMAIQGGTGAFAGASGTVTSVPQGEDVYRVTFDINCN
jgi:hypothetical protein